MINKMALTVFLFFPFFLLSFKALSLNYNNVNCDLHELNGMPYASSGLRNSYGPYDYTNPTHFRENLTIVELGHFDSYIERLIKSPSLGRVSGNLRYTLHAFPNHHRALNAMAKLQRQAPDLNIFIKKRQTYTISCYFKRAIHFQPKDATSRMLYGMHLHLTKKYDEAKKQYNDALSIQPENIELHYNLGLLYIDIKNIEKAKLHAEIAYSGGYPLEGLKNKINNFKSYSINRNNK